MPDIFLSYSSKDRVVAERVQAGLTDAGYDVFWDQNTPPGIDWDTWIRTQLKDARCVIVLWSKASVSSPNVRHEAMIGRERAKLLPVMIDDLDPTDFPMGLFLVQALMVGRTKKSLSANWDKLLEEVRIKVEAHRSSSGDEPADLRPKTGGRKDMRPLWRRPWVIGGAIMAVLLAIAVWQFGGLLTVLDPNRSPAPPQMVEMARNGERLARERVVRSAEEALTSNRRAVGTSWVWLTGQLMSAAPEEARGIAPEFFRYLAANQNAECGCFYTEDIPHAVGNGWVVITYAKYRQPVPMPLLRTVLAAQTSEGWWPISFTATRDTSNAALHATVVLTIALTEARAAGAVPAELKPQVDAAISRAVTWLNRGPENGSEWTDYPNNERRGENIVFAAMAAVASARGGEADGRAARAFRRAVGELPELTDSFPSNSYVELANGERFIDQYRHVSQPWIGAAAVLTYRDGTLGQRRHLRRLIRDWLSTDIGDERLLRQDWMTGETLFLRALAFPELERD